MNSSKDRFQPFRQRLQDEFFRRTNKNDNYSLRAFARDLEISPSTLSGVLAHKRVVSLKMATKILNIIKIREMEKIELLKCWSDDEFINLEGKIKEADLYKNLFLVFSILSFIETTEYNGSVTQIAKKLKSNKSNIENILLQMSNLNIVKKQGREFVATGEKYTMGDGKVQTALRALSLSSLSHAQRFVQDAEDKFRFEFSDLSLMFIPTQIDKIPEVKKKIRRFRRSLAKFMDSDEHEKSYLLAINLWPL